MSEELYVPLTSEESPHSDEPSYVPVVVHAEQPPFGLHPTEPNFVLQTQETSVDLQPGEEGADLEQSGAASQRPGPHVHVQPETFPDTWRPRSRWDYFADLRESNMLMTMWELIVIVNIMFDKHHCGAPVHVFTIIYFWLLLGNFISPRDSLIFAVSCVWWTFGVVVLCLAHKCQHTSPKLYYGCFFLVLVAATRYCVEGIRAIWMYEEQRGV